MVLIECPECKKEISSGAKFCPHCGCPHPNHLRVGKELVKRYSGLA